MRSSLITLLIAFPLLAQHRVDPKNMYERLLCIVPMTGKGTWNDPRRPMFAPGPGGMKADDRSGIIAWHFEPSDDGNFAIVEFIAVEKKAFETVLAANAPASKVFERGKGKRADVEREFKKFRKDFDFDRFAAGVR
jgi:hypothetical protein